MLAEKFFSKFERKFQKLLTKSLYLSIISTSLRDRATKVSVLLAQPVEHFPFKEVAVGSNPTQDTIFCATPSSSGPGPRPFTAVTGVQIP